MERSIQIAVAKADLLLCTWGAPVALGIVAVLAICCVIWYDNEI